MRCGAAVAGRPIGHDVAYGSREHVDPHSRRFEKGPFTTIVSKGTFCAMAVICVRLEAGCKGSRRMNNAR